MEKKRLFVGNLPHAIDEDDIKNKFSKYGDVLSVEIKHKYDGLNGDDVISTFAFVNIQAFQESLSTCVEKLVRKKWLGNNVTIEFAKESILSKLENERKANKESNNLVNKNHDSNQVSYNGCKSFDKLSENKKELNILKKGNDKKCKTFEINSNISKGNTNIMTKLENFSNVWKDSDERDYTKFDEDYDFSVVTADERSENVPSKKNIFVNDEYNSVNFEKNSNTHQKNSSFGETFSRKNMYSADEKRLKSIEELKKTIDQRKQTIKKALSSVDSGIVNKKIIFDDDDYNENAHQQYKEVNQSERKNRLFNEDSDDGENEEIQAFNIKQQFEGDKGKKLFELQSRFGNDSRFYMNETFYESDEEKIDNENKKSKIDYNIDKEESVNDEVKKQLQILQSIVGGTEFSSLRKKQKLSKHTSSSAAGIRYDPTVPEHEKFIVKPSSSNDESDDDEKPNKHKKRKNKLKDKDKTKEEQEIPSKPNVSKETFYEVANELKETFKSSEKSSFSFSELFKSSSELTNGRENGGSFDKINENLKKRHAPYNNFNDDRFGGDFTVKQENQKADKSEKANKTGSLWLENFFYKKNDPRFKEAQQFFSKEDFEVEVEDFEGKRKVLKRIIKKKVMNKARKDRPFKKKIGGMPKNRRHFKRRKLQ